MGGVKPTPLFNDDTSVKFNTYKIIKLVKLPTVLELCQNIETSDPLIQQCGGH